MEGPKDDLKWFGEGFDGFPKRLPEDCVEYTLLVIDSKLKSQREVASRLETVRKEAQKLTGTLLKDYIWQRDSFKLDTESSKGLMYLHGLTNYGDSVEDEWLIVYILKELSNRFPELWVRVIDTDGEFLLIEAANALPRWLNPEIAENRVWIHNNTLRIIPLSADSSSTAQKGPASRTLTLDEAVQTISTSPDVLIHSPMVEAEAFYRLRNYPSQIRDSLHHAPITMPRKLASILHDRPASIAPAVEAFYLRDPIALKSIQKLDGLIFPPADLVTVSTRFTRVLYAQVKSQQFSPPPAWKDLLSMVEISGPSNPLNQKKFEQLEMGMKLTSGFEMLVNDPKNRDNRLVRELRILLEDIAIGDSELPTDVEIAQWQDVTREDDEKWMDINFEDFEKELQGKQGKPSNVQGTFGPEPPLGFGDAKTQADLKKMVERFEAFLNDEDAGAEGAEVDDMDLDDDDDDVEEDSDEEGSEDEDKEVSFDEKEFAKMMREMMGMPTEDPEIGSTKKSEKSRNNQRIEDLDSDEEEEEDEDEGEEIRKVMQKMEAELNEAGALNLDPVPNKVPTLEGRTEEGKDLLAKQDWEDESDEEVNIDFNLAKNLLESFKSQAGMAGPGGNMMGMMGMTLPRDEGDSELATKK